MSALRRSFRVILCVWLLMFAIPCGNPVFRKAIDVVFAIPYAVIELALVPGTGASKTPRQP